MEIKKTNGQHYKNSQEKLAHDGYYFLCPSSELEMLTKQDAVFSKEYHIKELPLFIVYSHGALHAYHNRCPHAGLPLNWLPDKFLDTGASLIQCSSHGALFTFDAGQCVAGPCQGQTLTSLPLKTNEGNYFVGIPEFLVVEYSL